MFLVDDQQMVRAGFRMLVDSQPDLTVVGEAGDGARPSSGSPSPPATSCSWTCGCPASTASWPPASSRPAPDAPAVIVLTTFDLDEYAFAAIKAGAAAFLLKDAAPPDLLGAIRSVHAGDSVVAPSTTRRLLEHFAACPARPGRRRQDDRLSALTEREREVLELVGRGRSNQEIAEDLVVAEATVKTHVSRLLAKTGSRDRVQLVVLAYEAGVVRPA